MQRSEMKCLLRPPIHAQTYIRVENGGVGGHHLVFLSGIFQSVLVCLGDCGTAQGCELVSQDGVFFVRAEEPLYVECLRGTRL